MLERGSDIGGTWRDNTYPGIAVDIPAQAYQFSYELKPDWSRVFAEGAEVKAYIDHCADRYDVRRFVRLESEVSSRSWDESAHLWRLQVGGRELTARFVISAVGAFVEPQAGRDRGTRRFPRARTALGGLGPLGGAHRQARRDRRNRRERGADHPRDRAEGGSARRLSANADLGRPEARPAHAASAPVALPPRPSNPTGPAQDRNAWSRGRTRGAGRPPRRARLDHSRRGVARAQRLVPGAGSRSRGPEAPHPGVRDRLQAARGLQHVPADVQPPERGARDRADRADPARRRANGRRTRARDRRPDPRHRLPAGDGSRELPAEPGPRTRRVRSRDLLRREPRPLVREREHAGAAQPLHDLRPLRLDRGHLARAGRDRVRAHPARDRGGPPTRGDRGRGARGGRRALDELRRASGCRDRCGASARARPRTATTSTSTATRRSCGRRAPSRPFARRERSRSTTTRSRNGRGAADAESAAVGVA